MSLDIVPDEVRYRVARVLLEKATRSINFRIGPWAVSGTDYETIAVHIGVGNISVAYGDLDDLEESGGVAYYQGGEVDGRSDVLYVPQAFGSDELSLDAGSVVVHEATHAIFDARKTVMRRLDSEMLAYFAQFWYGKAHKFDTEVMLAETGTMAAILERGYNCVRQYQGNDGQIDPEKLYAFRAAILAVPLYGEAWWRTASADGVRDPMRLAMNPRSRHDVLETILGGRGLSDPY